MEPVSAPENDIAAHRAPPGAGAKADIAAHRAPPGAGAKAHHGKQGSLDNPEVYENVPGHIIPILEREFDDFDNEAEKFLGGETPED
jgi:hypothetical protein